MCNVPYKCVEPSMSFGNGGPQMSQGGARDHRNPPWLRHCRYGAQHSQWKMHFHKAGLIAASFTSQWPMYTIDTSNQAVSRLVSSSDTTPEAVSAYKSLMIPVKSYRPPLPENFSVTVMKMYLLKHACMSVNMPECSSATFVQGTILGRFDQRLRRQGE